MKLLVTICAHVALAPLGKGLSPWIVSPLVCIMDPHVAPFGYFECHQSINYLTIGASCCRGHTSQWSVLCIASKWPMWTTRPIVCTTFGGVRNTFRACIVNIIDGNLSTINEEEPILSSWWLWNLIIIPHPIFVGTLYLTHAWCVCIFIFFPVIIFCMPLLCSWNIIIIFELIGGYLNGMCMMVGKDLREA